jgi:branched-subunit amino acid aminotransferase/4-amino-4-deoxychorismate lyase
MNIMMRIGDEVLTPPLSTNTILPGVTRDSVLTLLREWGIRVSERPIAIDEVIQAAHRGTLREVWGTGTAAVISPVGELAYKGERLVIGSGKTGELSRSCTTRSWTSSTRVCRTRAAGPSRSDLTGVPTSSARRIFERRSA